MTEIIEARNTKFYGQAPGVRMVFYTHSYQTAFRWMMWVFLNGYNREAVELEEASEDAMELARRMDANKLAIITLSLHGWDIADDRPAISMSLQDVVKDNFENVF